MGRRVFIAEKPSVARDFARALGEDFQSRDGYMESDQSVVTWCYGHLVTMSYPDAYDPKLRRWSLDTIPFIPDTFRYEVIGESHTRKQFAVVKKLLTAKETDTIYICTDSGREGEYIYRLVAQQAGVRGKRQLRVWIDSFTDSEIRRGIREAKEDSAYDNLGAAADLRAQEDYLMGINFSRALSLKYAGGIRDFLGMDHCVIAVGRVMTCVLGMIVRREREIRSFEKTPFYRVVGSFSRENSDAPAGIGAPSALQSAGTGSSGSAGGAAAGDPAGGGGEAVFIEAEWSAREGSRYYESPLLYKENGFRRREDAQALIDFLAPTASGEDAGANAGDAGADVPGRETDAGGLKPGLPAPGADSGIGETVPRVLDISHKKERRNPPLLYNLAELQNDCSRFFKLSPDQALASAQTLYERGLTTYPRTDARVLSSAVAAEIDRNLKGLGELAAYRPLVRSIAESGAWKKIAKTKYTNDKDITDHYAIIPTGEGLSKLRSLNETDRKIYDLIARRFLSIFYPPAVFDKITLQIGIRAEVLTASVRVCRDPGYRICLERPDGRGEEDSAGGADREDPQQAQAAKEAFIASLRKGQQLHLNRLFIREGETSPPKRYTGGSMILAMENAGALIEDETLREQIRGSGIGTSATRAGILEKLTDNQYIQLNAKTQIYTPTQLGEMIYDVVDAALRPLLDPRLTASWEKGLTQVAEGTTTRQEYEEKLRGYVRRRTDAVKESDFSAALDQMYRREAQYYPKAMKFGKKYRHAGGRTGTGKRKGNSNVHS